MCKSIFIIDDYEINLVIAKMIVKRNSNFDIISTYEEAGDALDFIISNRHDKASLPDIILLDLNMPVIDGWEFLKRFEALNICSKKIDIFILTSSMDLHEKQRAEQYSSVAGFLSKPLTPDMLILINGQLATAS